MRKVVITGMGVVSPLGCDNNVFADRLAAGFNGIGPITNFDASGDFPVNIAAEVRDFDIDAFFDAKEQHRNDRYTLFGLAAARLAVRDSGIDWNAESPERDGCLFSSGVGGLETVAEQVNVLRDRGARRMSPLTIPSIITNMASGLIAIEHHLEGPNFCITSACASSLHALGESMRIIQRGEADVMIAGGAEAAVIPVGVGAFAAMHALSRRNDDPTHACRPFDKDRDGFIMGEGSAALILEEYEHAKARGARIYAEIAGFGMSCDAHHMTAPRPDGAAGARAMAAALAEAGVGTDRLSYVNAHGTSTSMNDKTETVIVKRVLGEADAHRVAISSTKSMTGHLLGAAGALETAACLVAMQRGFVPPTINYTTPDPECDLDYTPNAAREMPVDTVLNNSLGFGGHNACIVLKKI